MAAEGTGEFPCWNDLSSIAAKMLDPNLQPEYIKQFYDEWAKSGTYDTVRKSNSVDVGRALQNVCNFYSQLTFILSRCTFAKDHNCG